MKPLVFASLSIVKRAIIRKAFYQKYVGDMTYPNEKAQLCKKGWLRSRVVDDTVISGQWELTDAGKSAFTHYLSVSSS